jgi:NADPH:quinone reductase-like Zn-dependent oxidoreductase
LGHGAGEGVVSIVGLVRGLNAEINLAEVFQKNLRLDGIETGSRSTLEDLLTWLDTKRVHPIITKSSLSKRAKPPSDISRPGDTSERPV